MLVSNYVSHIECGALVVLAIFIVLDILSGLIKAFYEHNYQSGKMRDGLLRKSITILIVIVGLVLDKAEPLLGLNVNIPVFMGVVIYVVVMEVASIIENVVAVEPRLANSKFFALFSTKIRDELNNRNVQMNNENQLDTNIVSETKDNNNDTIN